MKARGRNQERNLLDQLQRLQQQVRGAVRPRMGQLNRSSASTRRKRSGGAGRGRGEEVEFATLEWVAWYNTRRLLEPLGYVPPDEFEQAYYRHQTAPAELVTLT
jgi:hypothetical protein